MQKKENGIQFDGQLTESQLTWKERLQLSARELGNTRTLIMLGLFMALSIIVSSFRIRTPAFSISFGPLVKMYVALLFGPAAGAAYGCTLDLLQFAISNGGAPFFPGYTFTETLGVFLYGLFFYRRHISLLRVFTAKLVVIAICNLFLGTLWIAILSGGDPVHYFFYYLPVRTVKNLIQWPVDSVLFFIMAKSFARAGVSRMMASAHSHVDSH